MKIPSWLRKLASPEGPIGEWLSPSDVYKTRAGLPITASRNQRAEMPQLPAAQVERACAPERYYAKGEIDVPFSRERVVSPYIIERYKPVMAGMEITGWRVVQEPRSQFCDCTTARFAKEGGEMVHAACGRRREPLSDAEFMEKALTIQKAPDDAIYDQYAITIKGNDTAIVDGMKVTGGTQVRSRRHHRDVTRGMVFWDKGTPKCVEKALADENSKRKADTARAIERKTHRLISDHPGDI
jgi:hypothetical protein